MKKKNKIDKLCQASEGSQKQDQFTTEHYFTSPIYWIDKPEWTQALNKASDPFIKDAKKRNEPEIKKRNKK